MACDNVCDFKHFDISGDHVAKQNEFSLLLMFSSFDWIEFFIWEKILNHAHVLRSKHVQGAEKTVRDMKFSFRTLDKRILLS